MCADGHCTILYVGPLPLTVLDFILHFHFAYLTSLLIKKNPTNRYCVHSSRVGCDAFAKYHLP